MRLQGKEALVTGGTSGIGRAIVVRFAREGARVVFLGRDADRGRRLEEEVRGDGGEAVFLPCDLGDPVAVQAALGQLDPADCGPDILVNNAGIAPPGTVETLSGEEWDRVFAVNVRAVFLLCNWAVPRMRARGGGCIINVASTAGMVGADNLHAYSASKGAVLQLTRSMAADYAAENIRVNCLCPGATRTPVLDELEARGLEEFTRRIPAGRIASPGEIAGAALFLASGDASFVHGAALLADGGFTAI